MDKQQRAVLLEAEQRYRRAKESVALLTRYGADDNEGITADAEYLLQRCCAASTSAAMAEPVPSSTAAVPPFFIRRHTCI